MGHSLYLCLSNSGALAVILFRISQYLFQKKILWHFSKYIARLNQFMTGFECNIRASIDSGLFIPHSQNIVIGEGVEIGKNVTIYNGVTLGAKTMAMLSPDLDGNSATRYPIVEDDVVIFTGAKLIGFIRVGHNAIIGANAVVLKDVPPHASAVGVPAVIKSNNIAAEMKSQ